MRCSHKQLVSCLEFSTLLDARSLQAKNGSAPSPSEIPSAAKSPVTPAPEIHTPVVERSSGDDGSAGKDSGRGRKRAGLTAGGAGASVKVTLLTSHAIVHDKAESHQRHIPRSSNGPPAIVYVNGTIAFNPVSWLVQELEDMPSARQKRILANRQSAARSKERKLAYISELEAQVTRTGRQVAAKAPYRPEVLKN